LILGPPGCVMVSGGVRDLPANAVRMCGNVLKLPLHWRSLGPLKNAGSRDDRRCGSGVLASVALALVACNAYNRCMQYTIRNVPDAVDEALRNTARQQGKSLNEVAIEALARGAGVSGERRRQRDLSDIAGTWREDPAFDHALADQDTIDEEMWR